MAESEDNEANDTSSRSMSFDKDTRPVKRRIVYARDADVKRRQASIYDIVDGRFANTLMNKDSDASQGYAARESSIGPDEYWASRRRNREQSQERRKKKQDQNLEREKKSRRRILDSYAKPDLHQGAIGDFEQMGLPDSDLLKQLHAFTADYYASQSDAKHMYRMMDGSALMALGLLIQEHQRVLTKPISELYAEMDDTLCARTDESSEQTRMSLSEEAG